MSKRRDSRERQAWFLDAACIYCDAVVQLCDHLRSRPLGSRGLTKLRDVITAYRHSQTFTLLADDAAEVRGALGQVRYCVWLRGSTVEVSRYEGERDYSEEITNAFRRFQQGEAKDYRIDYRIAPSLGEVGSRILGYVAGLFPEEFRMLEDFCRRHGRLDLEQVTQVHFELGFYLSYLDYIDPLLSAGLSFCYPSVSDTSAEMVAEDTFDIVLAHKLAAEAALVVPNTSRLEGMERIFVVSGPNQGGKTTFARAFGQLHHLAAIGCPIPGRRGALGVFDQIFTHFQAEELPSDLRGKLEDDLIRMRAILETASGRSLIILNETFSSTTLGDARFLGSRIMEKMIALSVRAVFVTFVDELAALGPEVVSLMSEVMPEDPARRTFRILRAPGDGLAYAMAIAEKYGATYGQLWQTLNR